MPVHKLAKIYVNEIVVRHGVPVSIVSDRDGRFISNFGQDFQELGTKLHMSMAFHPKIDGQSERTIQTLEDMLRACVIDFGGNWRYRTPICWEEVGSRELASTDVVLETTEKIKTIRERLKEAQDRWKSYADNRRRSIEFNVGDFVMLKVSPWKGMFQFKNKGKLSLRFIGPFKILKRVGEVAYVLELPEEMRAIHNTFHVSYLRRCLADESSVITLDDIEINQELTSREELMTILGRKSRQLRNKVILLVKVQWKYRKGTSIRWELEENMRSRFEWSRQGLLQILQSSVFEVPIRRLEVGWIRRIQELDMAYWGFLGVGTTLDIFQNIILIPYLEYGVLSPLDTAY
ncbi:putative reverse transcriptase domain-containing protein [Tanacetum coccineum]